MQAEVVMKRRRSFMKMFENKISLEAFFISKVQYLIILTFEKFNLGH